MRNILSYGESPVTYTLDKSQTTMISAKNGAGKSSIIDAITFALYGKTFREIKKPQLVNSKNKKGLLVECKLSSNGKSYTIKRGIKPNIFEIYEGDKLLDQNAKSAEYQDILEKNIIGMNFNTFKQNVIISKTRYTPFMKLSAAERRSFVESMMNLEVFGHMLKAQSKHVSFLKTEISELNHSIEICNIESKSNAESLNRYKALVDKIKQESLDALQQKKKSLSEKIESIQQSIVSESNNIDTTDYSKHVEKYNGSISLSQKYKYDKENLTKQLDILRNESDICSACGSKLESNQAHRDIHINEILTKISALDSNIVILDNNIHKLKPLVDSHNEQYSNNKIIQSKISSLKDELDKLNDELSSLDKVKLDTSEYDNEIDKIKDKIRSLITNNKSLKNDLQIKLSNLDDNEYALMLLKDSWIKSSIINEIIPSINIFINSYLQKFGFFIKFELNSEFEETIHLPGAEDLCYNNFSEGEKLRIDIAILLAWREMSLMKNNMSCNLLFFDEIVDASMDTDGVELFARAISSLKNTNVWNITHTPEKLENYMRSHIRLDKTDGFTIILK